MGDLVRRGGRWAAVALVALAGAWIALLIDPGTDTGVGPLQVQVQVRPAAAGDAVVEVPPLGTLRFDTHAGPAQFRLQVAGVDVDAARALVDEPRRFRALGAQAANDIGAGLVAGARRSVAVATLGAVLLALLVFRRRGEALAAGLLAATLTLGSYALAWATLDRTALSSPEYTGLLRTAPRLVGGVQTIADNLGVYGDQLAALVANTAKLYEAGLGLPTAVPPDDSIRVLHVSDLHLNPAVWEVIRTVAEQYDVAAIVDTGDIADLSTPPEVAYVEPIGRLGRPYVYVRGNHDSTAIEAAIAALPNAVVMDGTVHEVAGLRVIGAPDPRFTPDQTTRGDDADEIAAARDGLAQAAEALEPPADLLLFHDPTGAEAFDGTVPLVLAGHAHRRSAELFPAGTRLLVQGSTGGAGLRALEGEEPTPVTLSVLYLDPDTRRLQAWDEITLGGLGQTTATIKRETVDEDPAAAAGPLP